MAWIPLLCWTCSIEWHLLTDLSTCASCCSFSLFLLSFSSLICLSLSRFRSNSALRSVFIWNQATTFIYHTCQTGLNKSRDKILHLNGVMLINNHFGSWRHTNVSSTPAFCGQPHLLSQQNRCEKHLLCYWLPDDMTDWLTFGWWLRRCWDVTSARDVRTSQGGGQRSRSRSRRCPQSIKTSKNH